LGLSDSVKNERYTMAIISTEDVMLEANLGKQVDPLILAPHIESAEIELKKILGAGVYSRIEGYQASGNAGEMEIFSEVKKGGIYLAMSYAIHSLNIETQGNGLVKVKGWNQSRSELLSKEEVIEMSSYFRTTAMLFLQPYIVNDDEEEKDNLNLGEFYLGAL
jgi:hypothetical protein